MPNDQGLVSRERGDAAGFTEASRVEGSLGMSTRAPFRRDAQRSTLDRRRSAPLRASRRNDFRVRLAGALVFYSIGVAGRATRGSCRIPARRPPTLTTSPTKNADVRISRVDAL